MKKFKVCTYHIDFKNTESIYEMIYNITSQINKKYCELNNYEYSFDLFKEDIFTNFLNDDIFKIEKKWNKACIYKYQYLLNMLESSDNDYIVYVEYDACFCNTIKKLENYIDDKHSIFYSRCNWSWDIQNYLKIINNIIKFLNTNINDIFDYEKCADVLSKDEFRLNNKIINHHFFCNEGFYIFKNDEISKNFLKSIVKYAPLFYEGHDVICCESQIIGEMMNKTIFMPHLKVLPPKTQGHIYGGSNKYDEDECLVCHNSSIDKNILYEKIVNISENKYWKGIL